MSEQAAAVVETPVSRKRQLRRFHSDSSKASRNIASGGLKGETGEPDRTGSVTPAAKPVETPATEVEPDPASEAGKELAKQKGRAARADRRADAKKRRDGTAVSAAGSRIARRARGAEGWQRSRKDRRHSSDAEGAKEYKRIMALTGAPKVSEFDTYEEFQFAASLFVSDVRSGERDQRQQAESATRGAAEAQGRVYEAAKAAHADVDEVMTSFVNAGHRFAPVVQDVVVNHPLGHEIAYVLAKDPARHAAIAAIKHPGLAMIELGKVIAGIEAGAKPAAKAEPVKKVSSAPAPVEPVTPGETSTGRPDPANITSIATWNKERKNYL
jgi:hypothetical protein